MSNHSPTVNQDSASLLADGENERLSWQGVLKESDENEYPALFVATDNRLIFSLGGGHFKDIGFNHVESVEAAADAKSQTDGTDPDALIAMGAISVVIGFGAMFAGGFSALASLVGLCFCGLGVFGVFYAKGNYDKLKDELEVIEYTVYHVILRTTAESPFNIPIYFETEENVGPELSKLVQENQ